MSTDVSDPLPNPALSIDDNGIAWVSFNDPERKLNVLAEPVMRRLAALVEEVRQGAATGLIKAAVFHSDKPDSFIAGADVEAIAAIEDPALGQEGSRFGQSVYLGIDQLPVPTVAAIHGICLGGGTELALACDFRIASDSPKTRIGLPEVQLGILPAWGGTTRLPRLVGLRAALDMILTGKQLRASKARRIGLVDKILPAEMFLDWTSDFARARARGEIIHPERKRGVADRFLDGTSLGRRLVLASAHKRVVAQTGGHYPAPLRILQVVRQSYGRPLSAALELESQAGGELIASEVSKNLLHLFTLREESRKENTTECEPVEHLGVLGAGIMGGGIAQLAAYHGVRVRMKDIRHQAIGSGIQHARELFDKAVQRRRLSQHESRERMELISGGLDYAGFGRMQLVVEAVVERMDVKRAVLAETEQHVSETCILASNTSSLSIDEMARDLERPENVCGMHFFNPVHRMPLVEVIRGSASDAVSVATVYAFALRLGKVPVVVGDGPGFLVNRILGPYLNEAGFLLGDGASIRQIDAQAKQFGMPMGPLRLIDEVGIDISAHAGAALHEGLGDRLTPSPVLVALAKTDRLGRKGGRGFYLYEKGRQKKIDESVYADLGASVPNERRKLRDRDIRARLVVQMINEAARALDQGIVRTAAEVDLAMIMGTGFPPFRGGLLRFADSLHPKGVLDRARELEQAHGDRFAPADLLLDLAKSDRTFYEAFST
jgi:3-hydroxyacyl-CoA dehydrogenase/enoyl-CoA hydratase/3-hydroxybutyryl-CoA epimerase